KEAHTNEQCSCCATKTYVSGDQPIAGKSGSSRSNASTRISLGSRRRLTRSSDGNSTLSFFTVATAEGPAQFLPSPTAAEYRLRPERYRWCCFSREQSQWC